MGSGLSAVPIAATAIFAPVALPVGAAIAAAGALETYYVAKTNRNAYENFKKYFKKSEREKGYEYKLEYQVDNNQTYIEKFKSIKDIEERIKKLDVTQENDRYVLEKFVNSYINGQIDNQFKQIIDNERNRLKDSQNPLEAAEYLSVLRDRFKRASEDIKNELLKKLFDEKEFLYKSMDNEIKEVKNLENEYKRLSQDIKNLEKELEKYKEKVSFYNNNKDLVDKMYEEFRNVLKVYENSRESIKKLKKEKESRIMSYIAKIFSSKSEDINPQTILGRVIEDLENQINQFIVNRINEYISKISNENEKKRLNSEYIEKYNSIISSIKNFENKNYDLSRKEGKKAFIDDLSKLTEYINQLEELTKSFIEKELNPYMKIKILSERLSNLKKQSEDVNNNITNKLTKYKIQVTEGEDKFDKLYEAIKNEYKAKINNIDTLINNLKKYKVEI